jgi:hypothetical protein
VSGLAAPSLSATAPAFPSSRRTDLSRRRPHEGISGGASPFSRRSRARRIVLRLQRMVAASSSSSRYTGSAMGDLILGQHRGKRPQRSRRACDVCGRIACSPWWGGLIIKNNSSGGVAWHHVAWGRLPGGLLRYSAGLWFAGWAGLRCFSLLGGKDTLSLTVATLARTTHP